MTLLEATAIRDAINHREAVNAHRTPRDISTAELTRVLGWGDDTHDWDVLVTVTLHDTRRTAQ